MPDIIDHVSYLSEEIGPRPGGTEEEQQAALYIADYLQKEAGLAAEIEDFTISSNTETPSLICAGILLVAVVLGLAVPAMGILAFCYGCIVYSLFEIMIDTHYTGKMINVGLFRQFRDILPTILLSFFVFGLLLGIVNVITNLYYQIILGFIVALAIYLGCAFFFKFQELKDVKYMLKR